MPFVGILIETRWSTIRMKIFEVTPWLLRSIRFYFHYIRNASALQSCIIIFWHFYESKTSLRPEDARLNYLLDDGRYRWRGHFPPLRKVDLVLLLYALPAHPDYLWLECRMKKIVGVVSEVSNIHTDEKKTITKTVYCSQPNFVRSKPYSNFIHNSNELMKTHSCQCRIIRCCVVYFWK